MSAGAQPDYDALAQKYGGSAAPSVDFDALAQKHGGTVASQGTPIPNTSTIGPDKTAPLESNFIDDAEGLTQEGRKEHPIKAAVGDVARSAGQLRDIVAPEVAVLAPGLAAGPGAAPAPEAPASTRSGSLAAAPAPEPPPVNPVQHGPGEIAREQVGAPPGVLPKPFSSTVGSRGLPGGGMLVRPGLLSQGSPQSLSDWLIGGGSSAPAPEVAPAAVPTVPASPAAAPAPKPAMQSLTDWLNQTTTKAQPPPQPLSSGVPLREQVSNTNPVFQKPPSELATRRPDLSAPQRQFAHANSEEALDAIGGNADLMKSFHSLKNADIAGVYEKAGGPVGAQPGEAYTGPPPGRRRFSGCLRRESVPIRSWRWRKGSDQREAFLNTFAARYTKPSIAAPIPIARSTVISIAPMPRAST